MSQQYLLPCACGQKLRVAPAQAGGQVTCACGQSLAVPTLRGLKALEPARDASSAPAAPGWSTLHGLVFSLSLVVAAAGVATLASYLWLYTSVQQQTVDHTEEWIAMESAPVDEFTPVQDLQFWKANVESGIHQEFLPSWVTAKAAAARYLFWVKVGGCLLVGGLVPAIATLYIGRGRKH
jgi:hypothetical protein